jgi:hypothetical protein
MLIGDAGVYNALSRLLLGSLVKRIAAGVAAVAPDGAPGDSPSPSGPSWSAPRGHPLDSTVACSHKSPKLAEVLPLLCLHGLSTGDFVPTGAVLRLRSELTDHDQPRRFSGQYQPLACQKALARAAVP